MERVGNDKHACANETLFCLQPEITLNSSP